MDLLLKNELAQLPDLRHRLRQLRWFRATFQSSARLVARTYNVRFEVDEKKLTKVFASWVDLVNAQKGYARIDRADFIVFAAGLALRELVRQQPARLIGAPEGRRLTSDNDEKLEIVHFWPEGFLYTNYCVGAIAALYEQEFGYAPAIDKCADDLRTWWSFRENVSEVSSYAIAFLDSFLGMKPNWLTPDVASAREAIKRALKSNRPVDAIRKL